MEINDEVIDSLQEWEDTKTVMIPHQEATTYNTCMVLGAFDTPTFLLFNSSTAFHHHSK